VNTDIEIVRKLNFYLKILKISFYKAVEGASYGGGCPLPGANSHSSLHRVFGLFCFLVPCFIPKILQEYFTCYLLEFYLPWLVCQLSQILKIYEL